MALWPPHLGAFLRHHGFGLSRRGEQREARSKRWEKERRKRRARGRGEPEYGCDDHVYRRISERTLRQSMLLSFRKQLRCRMDMREREREGEKGEGRATAGIISDALVFYHCLSFLPVTSLLCAAVSRESLKSLMASMSIVCLLQRNTEREKSGAQTLHSAFSLSLSPLSLPPSLFPILFASHCCCAPLHVPDRRLSTMDTKVERRPLLSFAVLWLALSFFPLLQSFCLLQSPLPSRRPSPTFIPRAILLRPRASLRTSR